MNTYGRVPIALSHGQGCRVWDINGKHYLDALAASPSTPWATTTPSWCRRCRTRSPRSSTAATTTTCPTRRQLAAKLVELSGMTNVFFCSTGLEANEAALKLARKFGHDKGIERPEIVVYEKAFHGRSIATLSATGNEKVQKGFGPLVEGFIRVPLNDIEALKKATDGNPNVVAVFFETIQGEGGVNPMRIDYLQQVRQLCDERDWLLMIDEVQCGMGRTGKWFAHQWAGIKPDVMPLAKGLGSGVPIGAVVAGPKAANIFQPGNHGTTFGGNPLAMRAGVETIRIMEEDGLLDNAAKVGAHLKGALERELGGSARRQGNPRPGPDDRRRTDQTLRRADAACGRQRPAHQRHRRQRDPPGAAADHDRRRGRRSGGHPGAADPAVPGGVNRPWHLKHYLQFTDLDARRIRLPVRARRADQEESSRPTRSTTRWPTARWP